MKSVPLYSGCGLIALGLALRTYAAADLLDVWQRRNPFPTGNPLNSVAFLKGQFVTAGSRATLLVSTDGSNWVQRFVPGEQGLTQAAFGSGLYVVVGYQPGAGVIL